MKAEVRLRRGRGTSKLRATGLAKIFAKTA